MKTKKYEAIPDAINCSCQKDFTQIPNDFIRNPNISMKAKVILCILLGNKKGWKSYMKDIKNKIKEGLSTIQTGIKELEENHYLLRIKYREKDTKIWRGSFWAYADSPNKFNFQKTIEFLNEKNLECLINKQVYPHVENPHVGNPYMANPHVENQTLIIYNNNNSKIKNTNSFPEEEKEKKITSKDFDIFWNLYPKKIDKGKALTKWNTLCNKSSKNKPTLKEIKIALHYQKKSERWQNKQFIPYPTTWLNQSRWLDDPKEMKNILYNKENKPKNGSRYFDNEDKEYTDYDKNTFIVENGKLIKKEK